MSLNSIVFNVSQHLPVRQQSAVGKQALKELIDNELASAIGMLFPNHEVKGHTQQGRWADVPWVGIHDKRIDSSPQTGIYVAILFAVDGSRVALTIQHGTEKKSVCEISELVAKASTQFGNIAGFLSNPLKLRPEDVSIGQFNQNSRPGKYEIANILGCQYEISELPESFGIKLSMLVDIYNSWVQGIILQDQEEVYQDLNNKTIISEELIQGDYPPPDRVERSAVKTGSQHPPRDPKEGEKALERASYLCEVDSEHITFLTAKGKNYMEKHHLIPMEKYFDFGKSIDHYSNIFALCPNCHKKIHNARAQDKKELIKLLFQKRGNTPAAIYGITLSDLLKFYKV